MRLPVVLLIALATTGVVAQPASVLTGQGGTPAPARDPGAPPSGTGGVSGRVTAAADGTPLARAIVDLMCAGMTSGPLSVETDDEGRYEFRAVAPGACYVSARRRGYVEASGGREVTVAQTGGARVDIALERSGVISGRVVDELGEPMSRVMVSAVRRTRSGQEGAVQGRDTDDEGRFRLFDLPPGSYVVRAEPMQRTRLTTGAETSLAYAPAFAPGVPDAASAQLVVIGRSRDIGGVEIRLVRQRTYRVAGTVVRSDGRPPRGAFLNVSRDDGTGGRTGEGSGIDAAGRFRVEGLAAGDYTLEVRYEPLASGLDAHRQPAVEYARQEITITDDLDGLTIVTTPTATVNGELVLESAPVRTSLPPDLQIVALPPDPRTGPATIEPSMAQVGDDRRFTLRGLAGPVVIRTGATLDGWWLERVMYRGEDVTNQPTELRSSAPGQVDLLLVFTNRAARVAGHVTDAAGRSVAGAKVLAFAEPRTPGLLLHAGDGMTTADETGAFRLEGLTADRYLLAAVRKGESWSEDMYERCAEMATAVTLLDRDVRTVNLEVIALPQP